MKLLTCILFFITITAFAQPATITHKLNNDWAEVQFDSLGPLNKMAYADTANFMHQKVYPCARCLLRPEVSQALEKAYQLAQDKGYRLVLYDCYRPYPIQYKMYEIVNNPLYVAKPGKGSNHNRGQAVDISLADENGTLLDMGSAFDEFSEVSHYAYSDISRKARRNRRRLRNIMTEAGFTPMESEWWHFDYKQRTYDTSDYVWDCY